jgi:hypothetical protein
MLIKFVVEDYNKPVVSEIDQIIYNIIQKKTVKYISDGIELKPNFIKHYLAVLDIKKEEIFDMEMIIMQANKQLTFYNEDIAVGYKTRCDSKHIILAKNYILDNYNYLANLN